MNRRTFLTTALAASLAGTLPIPRSLAAQLHRPPHILLRSSWQIVNIGDIAHTPGVLALLEKHIPAAEVTLWASADLSPEVAAMLQKRFPKRRIVKGTLDAQGNASTNELRDAVASADFLLHGSGPSLVGRRDVEAFSKHTGKPFGVYGITYGGADAGEKELLSAAQFAYFRDSVSLAKAKSDGITCPTMGFTPDGAFAADVRNDAAATAFLQKHALEEGKFLCCIPRLRFTPYWKIRNTPFNADAQRKHARNEEMKEHDHAPLRAAITAVTRQTPLKVLMCPEDRSQMDVGRELLLDKLPDDVKPKVVWRPDFWLTDEALSTYVRSAGLFGLEMHSPIMCIGNAIPAIVCRFAEQTSKGFMWHDIGLADWLFDFDNEEEIQRLVPTVLTLATDPAAARAKAAKARDFVRQRQRETMETVAAAAVKA